MRLFVGYFDLCVFSESVDFIYSIFLVIILIGVIVAVSF